jgi:hypothetical protein
MKKILSFSAYFVDKADSTKKKCKKTQKVTAAPSEILK